MKATYNVNFFFCKQLEDKDDTNTLLPFRFKYSFSLYFLVRSKPLLINLQDLNLSLSIKVKVIFL